MLEVKTPQFERSLEERLAGIRILIVECEGSLSDGSCLLDPAGRRSVSFCRADILGIRSWLGSGRRLYVLGEKDLDGVEKWCRANGVSFWPVEGGKDNLVRSIMQGEGAQKYTVAYLGVDLDDLMAMNLVEIAAAPAGAHPWVRDAAEVRLKAAGGAGALRELMDAMTAGDLPG